MTESVPPPNRSGYTALTPEAAYPLFVRDLALHAALNYYSVAIEHENSIPPSPPSLLATTKVFEAYLACGNVTTQRKT